MVKKAVVTAGGLGKRLHPITTYLPKEMFPLIDYQDRDISLKPILQIIIEQLYRCGVEEFCVVINPRKRVIEDYFKLLKKEEHYPISYLTISFVVQRRQKGFGDAVLLTEPFVDGDDFFVFAGDTVIVSEEGSYIKRLLSVYEEHKPSAVMLLQKVENPSQFGVVEGELIDGHIIKITRAQEKPEKPPTNLAIVPVYIFSPLIFSALRDVRENGKLELTSGINQLAKSEEVYGIELNQGEWWYDIGDPKSYYLAIKHLFDVLNV